MWGIVGKSAKHSSDAGEMNGVAVALLERRRHRSRFRVAAVAIAALVAVLGIAVFAAIHYRFHLLWLYEAHRLELQDVQAVPDSPMPDSPTPDDWVRCRVGCIEFSLPPELAGNRTEPRDGAKLIVFQHGASAVFVAPPKDIGDFPGFLKTASELCPQSQRFTIPRLRRACYQVRADEFRWSMTPQEVRWHTFCVTMNKLIKYMPGGHTESLFRQDLDCIIHFGDERAVFEWQTTDGRWHGYMHFKDNGTKIDPAWIRAVCQSLKITNDEK
jgi:hypothetical protein